MKKYLSNRRQRVFFNESLSNIIQVKSGIHPWQLSKPLTSTFTNDLPLALSKELQLVSEWVARNKLFLNISKTKSIVFGKNHSLNPKPQLNLVINNVEIEQVVTP